MCVFSVLFCFVFRYGFQVCLVCGFRGALGVGCWYSCFLLRMLCLFGWGGSCRIGRSGSFGTSFIRARGVWRSYKPPMAKYRISAAPSLLAFRVGGVWSEELAGEIYPSSGMPYFLRPGMSFVRISFAFLFTRFVFTRSFQVVICFRFVSARMGRPCFCFR